MSIGATCSQVYMASWRVRQSTCNLKHLVQHARPKHRNYFIATWTHWDVEVSIKGGCPVLVLGILSFSTY